MQKNGITLSKKELSNIITEARLDELNRRETNFVEKFKEMFKKIADSDKELSLFCETKGIEKKGDNYLILASYLYSCASKVELRDMYFMAEKLNDRFIKECCGNLVDVGWKHRKQMAVANNILTKYAFGNKFVACNIWKILTNKGYAELIKNNIPQDIEDAENFSGEMTISGKTYENACKYTQWSLLWLMANDGSNRLEEARKNGTASLKRVKKIIRNQNRPKTTTSTQDNTEQEIITKQSDETGKTTGNIMLLNDAQVNDIVQRIKKLGFYEEKINEIKNKGSWENYAGKEKISNQVVNLLNESFEKYIPYLGQAAKLFFVRNADVAYTDKNNYRNLNPEGKKWDSEELDTYSEDDLNAAIEKMAKKYRIGSKFGINKTNMAKGIETLGSGIRTALSR